MDPSAYVDYILNIDDVITVSNYDMVVDMYQTELSITNLLAQLGK